MFSVSTGSKTLDGVLGGTILYKRGCRRDVVEDVFGSVVFAGECSVRWKLWVVNGRWN